MATPSSATTFEDLLLDVAEKLNVATYNSSGEIYIPTDKFNFALCKKYVNEGIKMFMADQPRKGWRWMRRICSVTLAPTYTGTATGGTAATLVDSGLADTYAADFFKNYTIYIKSGTGAGESAVVTGYTSASGTFAFTALSGASTPDTTSVYTIATSLDAINGDGARYMLPANFGGTVDGKIKYAVATNHGTPIDWYDESFIRNRRSVSVSSGYPIYAAVRPYQPTSEGLTQSRRWELIVDPQPSANNTVEFPYTLFFDSVDMEFGTVDTGGSATTLIDATRTEPDDYFIGWMIKVVDGTGKGSHAIVTGFAKATGTFTVAKWLDVDGTSTGTVPAADSIYLVQSCIYHPAGHQFDDAIKAAVLARVEMESQDQHNDNFWQDYYHKKGLLNAYNMDGRSAPRKLGKMTNGPSDYWERTWETVTYD